MAQTTEEKTSSEKKARGNEFIPFYFSDLVKGILKFWWVVILLAVIFGAVRFGIGYTRFSPVYSTSATFTISTSTGASRTDGGMTSYSYYYDSAMTTQLATAFPYILASNILQDSICEELGYTYLPASLSASSVSGSNMFTITCTGSDPQQVYDIIICAIDKCPEAARYVVGNIKFTMITNPYVPDAPYNRNSYVKDAEKTALLGAFLGVVWILLYCVSRKTIRTKEAIDEELGQECLGVLPRVSFKRHKQKIDRSILWTNPNIGRGFLESLRLMRNTVAHALTAEEKTILITSTAPGEGKTTVAANLALSLTQLGKKVLLIDWDIRNPSICEALDIDPDAYPAVLEEDTYRMIAPEQFGISLLVFTQRETYWKRMRVEYVNSVLDRFRDAYDCILVDTPPCGLISDTSVISQCVDAAVFVILQDTVRISRIKTGLDNLLSTNLHVLGCVFNGAQSGMTGYGENYGYSRYSYYSKYGYGYGYGYGEKNKKSGAGSRADKHKTAGGGNT